MNTKPFTELNLSEDITKAIAAMGFEEATPIQAKAIPAVMTGKDVIGQAQTGTGKTCAFAILAVEMLQRSDEAVQVLVLCPTRELAIQTAEEFKNVSKFAESIRILPIFGGQAIERQISALKRRPQIIIGTPGRVMDHMRRKTLKLGGLRTLILDEADEMLSMGFQEDLDTILQKTPEVKQTVLFSATMPRSIIEITKKYQTEPIHIKIEHKELTVPNIEQYCLEVRDASKLDMLSRVIDGNNIGSALVFCNTKRKVDELTKRLQTWGYMSAALHGDIRQNERNIVMTKFRNGDINVLVATDVAARGIDVDNLDAVFNYDIPNDEEYYVHRIGRTGRAGKTGKAYTFISGREFKKIKDIQRYTKAKIKLIKPPTRFDIEDLRMKELIAKVSSKVKKGHNRKYEAYIEKIVDELNATDIGQDITTLDVAAALFKMLAKKTEPKRSEENTTHVHHKKPFYPSKKYGKYNKNYRR